MQRDFPLQTIVKAAVILTAVRLDVRRRDKN
jgi:hypothetical protein